MTQSPTEAWLKEAYRAARENFEKENPHLANDEYYKQNPEKSMTFRAHLAGQQCERERSATDEQEWEKSRDELANKDALAGRVGMNYRQARRAAFKRGFDAAVNLITRPLLAELKRWKEWGKRRDNDAATANFDLVEARAEAASLRAENERLRKTLEWELEYLMGCTFQGSRHPYQTQIDKLKAALENRKAREGK